MPSSIPFIAQHLVVPVLCSRLERRLRLGPPGCPKLYFRAFAELRAGCSLAAAGSVLAVEDIRSLIRKSAQTIL